MKPLHTRTKVTACVALSALVAGMLMPTTTRAQDNQGRDENRDPPDLTFTVYAALDLKTLAPPDGMNIAGASLIVFGNLFRSGDGMEGANANNDPNQGEVIGRILCRATIVDPDFSHPFGTFVTELYSWPDGVSNLLADGIGPNLGFTSHRIVSGGTGRFRNMIGEIEEKEIGFNNTGGCNLRVSFKLTKAGGADHIR